MFLVLLTALAVRVGFALYAWVATRDLSVFLTPDSLGYLALARGLATHGSFSAEAFPDLALLRTPGYPLFLVPGVWLGHPEAVAIAVQIGMALATVLAVYAITFALVESRRAALAAAALYAFEPLSVTYSALILTETAFTVLLTWAVYFLVRYLKQQRLPPLLGAITLLVLSVYVRPAGYFLPFCVIALFTLFAMLGRRWNRIPGLSLALALVVVLILPWHARNRAHGFNGFAGVSAVGLYFYNAAALLAEKYDVPLEVQQRRMGYLDWDRYFDLHPEQREWSLGRRYAYMEQQGKAAMYEHLPAYLRMHLAGMRRILTDPGHWEVFRATGIYPAESGGLRNRLRSGGIVQFVRSETAAALVILLLIGILLSVYAFAALGVFAVQGWRRPAGILLLCTLAYLIAIGGGSIGYSRFRHPVMPILCVFAGVGLMALRERMAARGPAVTRSTLASKPFTM